MESGPESSEQETEYLPASVDLGNGRMGVEIRDKGRSFDLGNVFKKDSAILGADRITQVYFRTSSGNIYRLDDRGILINAEVSRRNHMVAGIQLNAEQLAGQRLTVGEPFRFNNGGETTTVVEIVATTSRIYGSSQVSKSSDHRNSMLDEFTRNLPASPTPRR